MRDRSIACAGEPDEGFSGTPPCWLVPSVHRSYFEACSSSRRLWCCCRHLAYACGVVATLGRAVCARSSRLSSTTQVMEGTLLLIPEQGDRGTGFPSGPQGTGLHIGCLLLRCCPRSLRPLSIYRRGCGSLARHGEEGREST